MKHKVSELEGALLDAAVAKAEGYELDSDGDNRTVRDNGGAPSRWRPSTDWTQGGPIIERERIATYPPLCVGDYDEWEATVGGKMVGERGPTPLIAAMRAYVASKFGEEVELP